MTVVHTWVSLPNHLIGKRPRLSFKILWREYPSFFEVWAQGAEGCLKLNWFSELNLNYPNVLCNQKPWCTKRWIVPIHVRYLLMKISFKKTQSCRGQALSSQGFGGLLPLRRPAVSQVRPTLGLQGGQGGHPQPDPLPELDPSAWTGTGPTLMSSLKSLQTMTQGIMSYQHPPLQQVQKKPRI